MGQQDRTITTSDGLEREFVLFLPESYEEGTPADIVFNFHGRGSNAIEQHLYSAFVPIRMWVESGVRMR